MHVRFNLTTRFQRIFVESDLKKTKRLELLVRDGYLYLKCDNFKVTRKSIAYNKVEFLTFASSPTFNVDIHLPPICVIRSPSVLTIYSSEIIVFWYKNFFL